MLIPVSRILTLDLWDEHKKGKTSPRFLINMPNVLIYPLLLQLLALSPFHKFFKHSWKVTSTHSTKIISVFIKYNILIYRHKLFTFEFYFSWTVCFINDFATTITYHHFLFHIHQLLIQPTDSTNSFQPFSFSCKRNVISLPQLAQ